MSKLSKRVEWNRKLTRILEEQLRELLIAQHIFSQANEVWAPHVGSTTGNWLHRWIMQNYVAFVGTSIRRIVDTTKPTSTISLVLVLRDMRNHTHLLDRTSYVEMYGNAPGGRFADRDFDKLAGKRRAHKISDQRIDRDLSRIERATRGVKRIVDKSIAHTEHDRRKRGRTTWGTIDRAIAILAETWKKYYQLVTARSYNLKGFLRDIDVSTDLKKIWP